MEDSQILKVFEDVNSALGGKGRALLRQSGTEPVIRIMIECEDISKCQEYANKIADKITEGGYCCE